MEFSDEFDVASHDAAEFSFGVPDEDELSITALGNGLMLFNAEDSARLPHSCAVAQPEFRHLWVNLSKMKDADKVRFLDAPIHRVASLLTQSRTLSSSSKQ